MTDFDKRALDANFALWKSDRMPDENEGIAFELYAIGAVLKDHDLADDDIDAGHIGGADDGGVDGMYFFVDGMLVRDEDHPLQSKIHDAELVLLQVKRSGGFSEGGIARIQSFLQDALEWDVPVDQLTHLNSAVRDCIMLFRHTYDRILAHAPTLRLSIYYVTGSPVEPHPKANARVNKLKAYVASKVSHARVTSHLWNCGTYSAPDFSGQ